MNTANPRFPHWCRIIRKTVDNPMVDEDDFSPFDSSDDGYDPMGGDTAVIGNVQYDNQNVPEETEEEENPDEGTETTVIYEGPCRNYKINTTSDKGEIITSQRGLALPLNQDGWDELGVVPMEGDEIVVVHGKTFKEYGRVIDKSVATAEFAGTHLVWRYGRN